MVVPPVPGWASPPLTPPDPDVPPLPPLPPSGDAPEEPPPQPATVALMKTAATSQIIGRRGTFDCRWY
jgi:hypothetical protein